MNLRDHPVMNFHGMKSWPPVWVNTHEAPAQRMVGEIGVLVSTRFYADLPKRIFLRMEFEKQYYLACLAFGEAGFCEQLNEIFQTHIGHSIKEIGDLDLSVALH